MSPMFATFLMALGCSFYCCVSLIYRLFFSPLASIPGPNTAKTGPFWFLWHEVQADYAQAMIQAHRRYGSVVRIDHNEVSICNPQASRIVLLQRLQKSSWYKIFAIPDSTWVNQMSDTNIDRFALNQKRLASGYTMSSMLKLESRFDEMMTVLEAHLDGLIDQETSIDLNKWFSFLIFDLTAYVTFSKPFGFLYEGTDVGGCIATGKILVSYLTFMSPFYKWHDTLMSNPLVRALDLRPMHHTMTTTENAVEVRQKSTEKSNVDCVEHWKAQTVGPPLTYRELLSAANANVVASTDTTGGQMQAFIYYMLRHPAQLAKLRNELDGAMADGRISHPAQWNETQDLVYFQACLKEVFRVHPISATGYPRIVPEGGLTVDGYYLPAGTVVSVNPSAIHRDVMIWGPDVDEFKPERWLAPESKSLEKYLLHFGAGYMQCPGRNFALLSLNKFMVTIFTRYELMLSDPSSKWKLARSFVQRPYGWGVIMKKRHRK